MRADSLAATEADFFQALIERQDASIRELKKNCTANCASPVPRRGERGHRCRRRLLGKPVLCVASHCTTPRVAAKSAARRHRSSPDWYQHSRRVAGCHTRAVRPPRVPSTLRPPETRRVCPEDHLPGLARCPGDAPGEDERSHRCSRRLAPVAACTTPVPPALLPPWTMASEHLSRAHLMRLCLVDDFFSLESLSLSLPKCVSQSHVVQYRANRCGPCMLSSPSGILAPRSTECSTILLTPKSVPTAGWIRVVLCQRVVVQLLLTQFFVQTWRSFAHITTQQSTKTQVWRASCQDPIPPECQDKITITLSCLGGHLQIHGDMEPSPVVLGEQATMEKTTHRFQRIATTLADLNAEGLNAQAVNDLLTMNVGAASQHVLRMSFVPEQETHDFDRQVTTFWSHLIQRDITSPLFFLPLKLGGLGVGSAVQRHAAAPWRAWQSIIPSLMSTTQSPDTDSLFFSSTPLLRAHLAQLQSTLSQQMNKPTFQLKALGAALRLQTTQKKQVSTIQRNIHKQFYNSLTDTPTEQAILLSQSTSHTGAHLMQPSSEAYEVEDRCFRVSVARRLMLPHPAVADPADVVQSCLNKSAAGLICSKPVDTQQHHCYGCRYGGGVDRRHAAVARCLADVTQSHSGAKVFNEQEVPALTRVVNGQTEHARMDLVFNLNGSVTYLDVSIVAPFSCNPSLVSAASTKPGLMAKRAEKNKFDRYPHINLVPFILETTGRPSPHARKFINDNPPLAVRDTWSAIQCVLHSAISKQQLTAAVT